MAGSFVGFLVERFGIAKVKQWYVDSTEAHQYFGKGLARLEREWREHLQKLAIDAAHELRWGTMPALRGTRIELVPLREAISELRTVPADDYAAAEAFFG